MPATLDLAKQPCPRISAQHWLHLLEALHCSQDHLALMQIKATRLHLTIAAWMVISHLPSGSLRGWLIGEGKSRQKSTLKFKQCRVCTHCLRGTSSLKSINSDECWSCSHLMVGPKGTRASHGAFNNACSISNEVATYTAMMCKTTS